MARLLHDGSLDTSFANDPSPVSHVVIFNGEIKGGVGGEYTGGAHPGRQLYPNNRRQQPHPGGAFTAVGGVGRNHIARLKGDGSLDPTFDPGTGTDGAVHALLYTQDKRLIIGGDFTTYNGVNRARIAKIIMGGGDLSGVIDLLLNSAPAP
jgi:hypothetical protein